MKRVFCIALLFILAHPNLYSEDDYIDVGSFLKKRTKQYPLPNNQRIILITPPRCGSTLIYNVLRFLFENDDTQFLWDDRYKNLVIKDHEVSVIDHTSNYILAIRNPIDMIVSWYRISCSSFGRILEASWFSYFVDLLVATLKSFDALQTKTNQVILLKYEDFSNDLDFLFLVLESSYSMEIDPRDKAFLKRALSKENVIKNTAKYAAFNEFDPYSQFHGAHIDQGDFAPSYYKFLRSEIQQLLLPHSEIFKKWGYNIEAGYGDFVEADTRARKIGA